MGFLISQLSILLEKDIKVLSVDKVLTQDEISKLNNEITYAYKTNTNYDY